MDSSLAPPQPNMVSSSEFRSSIKQAPATEVIKERAVKLLKDAEGASAVDAAVELHRKAILTAGTIQWGAERMSFSPETSVCRCCSNLDAPTVLETPEHFALCPEARSTH